MNKVLNVNPSKKTKKKAKGYREVLIQCLTDVPVDVTKGIRLRTRWMRGLIFGFIGLAIILLGAALARFGWDRFIVVPPHTKLTVYQSTNCTIYLLGANPQTVFSGETLGHNVSYGAGGVYDVGISGTGRILFKKTVIQVEYDRVSVNNKLLDSRPCTYVVSDDGSVKVGAIRTYD